MSQTLGEKLRQAREARGISISEVAEQTRISSLYLQSIENDDYKPLPGGIFNKGFVKSYAKFIGVDEQEALADYARLATTNETVTEQPLKSYRPEVLTDDNSVSSMAPTLIFAGIILALMTGGILFVLNYLQNRGTETANTNSGSNIAFNTPANTNTTENTVPVATGVPTMANLKAEFRAATDEISLTSVNDGKTVIANVSAGSGVTFEPKESLRLSYSKSLARAARLLLNGKAIALPEQPANPRRNVIEFEINRDNLAKIWNEGRIAFETAPQQAPTPSTPVNTANTSIANANRPPATPRPTPVPVNRPPVNRPPANAIVRPSPR
jgi:cytoskeleton protein RodZ